MDSFNDTSTTRSEEKHLFSTFRVADRLYGIDVIRVQEVTKVMPCTRVPLAPKHMRGLINLRGQIATAIELRDLFDIKKNDDVEFGSMNVFCEMKGSLVALIVDEIGDVIEVEASSFEETPDTVPRKIQALMSGVYKIPNELLSVLDIDKISTIITSANKE